MEVSELLLSKEEKNWIVEQRFTRLTDHKEVQIYPMGAERYLASVLRGDKKRRYNLKPEIENKDVLVIPGHGNSGFIFACAGAKSVTVYDKDPVTIAWMKGFKKYYNYCGNSSHEKNFPSVGELLTALTCWYPPLLSLPSGNYLNRILRYVNPQLLRRTYLFYMLELVRQAVVTHVQDNVELNKIIQFHTGEIEFLASSNERFDTAFVPYLLGVRNGVEKKDDIVRFIENLLKLVPKGSIFVNPSRASKEHYLAGKRYFVTTEYPTIQAIPELQQYFKAEDNYWFRTQGLAVFCKSRP